MATNYAFSDWFKAPDFNQALTTQRRNAETISAATQVAVEGAQAIARNNTEALSSHIQTALQASKAIMASGSPEAGIAKQADLAKSIFESALACMRDATETATKCSFEALGLISDRIAENIEEISTATGKATATAKKK